MSGRTIGRHPRSSPSHALSQFKLTVIRKRFVAHPSITIEDNGEVGSFASKRRRTASIFGISLNGEVIIRDRFVGWYAASDTSTECSPNAA